MGENDDIVKEFLIESYENLDQLDRDLMKLEKDPASQETLDSIFRTIHTIKGTTGFFGFCKLQSITHAGESLLSRLRDGEIKLSPDVASGLLAVGDAVREMLASIEATGKDGENGHQRLIERLKGLQTSKPPRSPAPRAQVEPEPESEVHEAPIPLGQLLVKSGQVTEAEVEAALEAQRAGDPRHLGEILVERGSIPPSAVKHAMEEQKQTSSLAANTVRVHVAQLDRLMNLVDELSLARNQIVQLSAREHDAAMLRASRRLNLITNELQEGVMKTRMQPIDNVWSMLPRIVRDLAVNCGKQIRIQMEGRETELDKTILEAIKDPLMHMVRNSVDHGIEAPEVRIAAGKPGMGLLSLRAFHEGGQVNIEVSDDGAGINLDRLKQKAIDRDLISPEQAAAMKDREVVNMIFLPGFSTATKITHVSGRGVGMDVVRTNIERIGGTVDVQSAVGRGLTLTIKIPLSHSSKTGDEGCKLPGGRAEGVAANRGLETPPNIGVTS